MVRLSWMLEKQQESIVGPGNNKKNKLIFDCVYIMSSYYHVIITRLFLVNMKNTGIGNKKFNHNNPIITIKPLLIKSPVANALRVY